MVREHFASLTQERPTAIVTHRIILADGQVRWQRWSDRAIFDENGVLIEYQSVGRDVTEQKQAEEALRRVRRPLQAYSGLHRLGSAWYRTGSSYG